MKLTFDLRLQSCWSYIDHQILQAQIYEIEALI